jgi:oligoendopeptidase F
LLGEEQPKVTPLFNNRIAANRRRDREARRTAWQSYRDAYLAFRNTLANTLATSIKQNVFEARSRGHASTLEAALFEDNIPAEVFHNLIGVFKKSHTQDEAEEPPLPPRNLTFQ